MTTDADRDAETIVDVVLRLTTNPAALNDARVVIDALMPRLLLFASDHDDLFADVIARFPDTPSRRRAADLTLAIVMGYVLGSACPTKGDGDDLRRRKWITDHIIAVSAAAAAAADRLAEYRRVN